MDRTSIVGDIIDYMKELLERINNHKSNLKWIPVEMNLLGIFED